MFVTEQEVTRSAESTRILRNIQPKRRVDRPLSHAQHLESLLRREESGGYFRLRMKAKARYQKITSHVMIMMVPP